MIRQARNSKIGMQTFEQRESRFSAVEFSVSRLVFRIEIIQFIDLSQYRYTTLTLKWTAYMRTTNRCDWGKKQDLHPY